MTDPERIAVLEALVGELRRELDELKRQPVHSMKRTLGCPTCGGTRLLYVRRVKESTRVGMYVDLSLTHSGTWWPKYGGPLEVYACRSCGLVEWHVIDFDEVVVDGTDVVEIAGPAPSADSAAGAPYR